VSSVPASEAPLVLAWLSAAGVTRGALFPGLAGVAEEFDESFEIPGLPVGAGGHTHETIGVWDRINAAFREQDGA